MKLWTVGQFLELQIEASAAVFFGALLWRIGLFAFKECGCLHWLACARQGLHAGAGHDDIAWTCLQALAVACSHLQASFKAEIWNFDPQSKCADAGWFHLNEL